MKHLALVSLAALLSSLLVAPAAAQCVAVDPTAVPDIVIDPLDAAGASQIMQPATLRFRRTGADTSPITVIYQIVDEDSPIEQRVGMNGGPQIDWRASDSGRSIGVLRQDAYALLRSGSISFGAGETSKDADVRLFVAGLADDLPAGSYRERYTVRYWCGDPNATAPNELAGVVSVTVRVPNVLSATIAGGSKRGEIDFMDFASPQRSLAISVRSTGPYSVSARSLNDRALVREGATTPTDADRIRYTMRFGGQSIDQGNGAPFVYSRAGLQGRQIYLDVAVEDVSKKRAGKYRDTLILTLTPVS